MQKGIKKVLCWVLTAGLLGMPCIAHAEAENQVLLESAHVVLAAQNEKTLDRIVRVDGTLKWEEDGLVSYFTYDDYLYDIREHAVYVPMEEIKDRIAEDDERFLAEDTFFYGTVDKLGENGYAATLRNMTFHRPEEEDRPHVAKNPINTKENPERVSGYRLAGDPWSYQNKWVQMEGWMSYTASLGSYVYFWPENGWDGYISIFTCIDGKREPQLWEEGGVPIDAEVYNEQVTFYHSQVRVEVAGFCAPYYNIETGIVLDDVYRIAPYEEKTGD